MGQYKVFFTTGLTVTVIAGLALYFVSGEPKMQKNTEVSPLIRLNTVGYLPDSPLVGGSHPGAKSWRDEQADFRTNEIAINWNAALIYALAGALPGR